MINLTNIFNYLLNLEFFTTSVLYLHIMQVYTVVLNSFLLPVSIYFIFIICLNTLFVVLFYSFSFLFCFLYWSSRLPSFILSFTFTFPHFFVNSYYGFIILKKFFSTFISLFFNVYLKLLTHLRMTLVICFQISISSLHLLFIVTPKQLKFYIY